MLSRRKGNGEEAAGELEEMMREALSQIPLYRSEWTNDHVSDPGIAILENLTAFQALQRSEIGRVSDEALEALCALAGFRKKKGCAAQAWLAAGEKGRHVSALPNQKFRSGELCFETERKTDTGRGEVAAVFLERDGEIVEAGMYLTEPAPGSVYPFGERPETGNCLYLIMDSLPGAGEWLRILARTKSPFPRNRMSEKESGLFAYLGWSLHTACGYRKILCRDETGGFLQDGVIALQMPAEEGCPDLRLRPEGYALRCRLVRSEYDTAPRVVSFQGPLFPVRQKCTLAVTLAFDRAEGIVAENAMLEDCYLSVYGLERDGFYHEYWKTEETIGETGGDRRFFQEKEAEGIYRFTLKGERLVRRSGEGEACAVLVLRDREIMSHYKTGRIYGYRDETLSLQPFSHILPDDFLVAACVESPDGGNGYQFFRPGDRGKGALHYTLLEEGGIRIEDAGNFEEAQLLLCSCAVHQGEKGNIRAGNIFMTEAGGETMSFYNPLAGTGGRYEETAQSVRRRLAADLQKPGALVKLTDYEEMIRGIPGLCIHKIKAFAGAEPGEVRIAVKPWSDEAFPVLSPLYRRVIGAETEKRRMLTVKVTILSPVYVPVDVSGTIHLKPFYEHGREQVETVLKKELDCISSGRNFGETLSFHEICRALEALDCVEEVCRLRLRPRTGGVRMQGADIRMTGGTLCCPGRLELEYGRKQMMRRRI